MGVIATALDSYRTKLTQSPASLTNLPQNVSIDDLPDTDKTYFRLRVADGPLLGAMHGSGALNEYTVDVALDLFWKIGVDSEEAWDTVADDVQNAVTVMLKSGNVPSGVVNVNPRGFIYEEEKNYIRGTGTFEFRFRVSADLT